MSREGIIAALREALLGMLVQHGGNWALSSDQRACELLGHPMQDEDQTDGRHICYCGRTAEDRQRENRGR